MAIYNQLPSTNITWDDIRDTLNANGGAVINSDVKSAFDVRAKINKWSFKKPMQKAQVADLTDADRYALNDGFVFTTYNTLADLNTTINNNRVWAYQLPTSYFRIGDYRGYDAKETEWFSISMRLIQVDKYLSVSIRKNIRAMLKSFPYWRNLLPSSAGSYYLTLYMQSGANSYMISMCDVASITETSMLPIFIYLNAEVPSGAYNVAIGLSSIGLIGTLQRAVAGGFYPLSDSFTPITIVSLNEEVSNLFKNMVFTITAITANKSPEGGGFYTYSMSSIKVKVKNNNASAVPLFITEGFVMSGTSKQSTMPSTGSTNFTVPAGEEVTVTYTFSNLYLYIQSSVGKAGVTFKMYDASSITSTISQNIT